MRTHNFVLVAGDTDGLAFRKPDHSPFTDEERAELLADLNSNLEELIKFEDDGVFPNQLVIAAKNYVLVDKNGKRKTKGSALKATTKERALRRFIQEVIDLLLENKPEQILSLYLSYARQIIEIKDITDWCSKHTVTKAVLNSPETAQVRLRNALKGRHVQEGDKFYTFFRTETERCLLENFDGTFDVDSLLGKLYDTMKIFKTVIDIKSIPNLTLKRNQKILKEIGHANSQLSLQV